MESSRGGAFLRFRLQNKIIFIFSQYRKHKARTCPFEEEVLCEVALKIPFPSVFIVETDDLPDISSRKTTGQEWKKTTSDLHASFICLPAEMDSWRPRSHVFSTEREVGETSRRDG